MKYSFLMPYYKRAGQLQNTLVSFRHFYENRKDFEIILVYDVKNTEKDYRELVRVLSKFELLNKQITLIPYSKGVYNPVGMFNRAALIAIGEFLVITSPEVMHLSNVLGGLDREFEKSSNVYVVCACEGTKDCSLFIVELGGFSYTHKMWYQHSVFRNTQYHFCTAISKENYQRIEGFDESFEDGIAYDDNDFRDRVMSAGIPFVLRDDLLTIHCKHDKHNKNNLPNYMAQLKRNLNLYKRRCSERGHEPRFECGDS